jgi:hypothetical protein
MVMRATIVFCLLAATASANITTSYFLPNTSYGTNRLRFVASVINASDDRVTLAVDLDDDPDYTNFGILPETWTFGSTLFEYSTSALLNYGGSYSSGAFAQSVHCEIPSAASSADCTASNGPELVKGECVLGNYTDIPENRRSAEEITQLYTFSDTDTAGVETIVRTIPGIPSSPNPKWCGTETDPANISVPSSELVMTFQEAKSSFNQYEFIITAGEEKLPSATTGQTASTGNPVPTGTEGSKPAFPGAAPMKTVAPALAGLGVAVAMFL